MASGNGSERKDKTFGMDWDSEKMLRLYMYNYMKKKGLDHVADTFTQEAKIDTFSLLDSEEGLLKEWWEVFWPQFSSMMENNAPGNSQLSTQSSMQAALAMLPSLQAMPGNSQNKVIPSHLPNPQIVATGGSSVADKMEQPPVSVLATTPIHNQRRAGKLPVNTETDSILGKSSAQAIQKGPLGFPPVKVLPTSGNPSNLHVQAPVQSPLQVTKDPRNDVGGEKPGQMESNGL